MLLICQGISPGVSNVIGGGFLKQKVGGGFSNVLLFQEKEESPSFLLSPLFFSLSFSALFLSFSFSFLFFVLLFCLSFGAEASECLPSTKEFPSTPSQSNVHSRFQAFLISASRWRVQVKNKSALRAAFLLESFIWQLALPRRRLKQRGGAGGPWLMWLVQRVCRPRRSPF